MALHAHLCYYKKACKANIHEAHPRMLVMSEREVGGKTFTKFLQELDNEMYSSFRSCYVNMTFDCWCSYMIGSLCFCLSLSPF